MAMATELAEINGWIGHFDRDGTCPMNLARNERDGLIALLRRIPDLERQLEDAKRMQSNAEMAATDGQSNVDRRATTRSQPSTRGYVPSSGTTSATAPSRSATGGRSVFVRASLSKSHRSGCGPSRDQSVPGRQAAHMQFSTLPRLRPWRGSASRGGR